MIVLKAMDEEILKQSKNSIEAEILKSTPFAKVDDIYVIEKTHIIKVRFKTMAMADKIKETGLRLYWFSIPARNIEYEKYVTVPQCMVCYAYDHTRNTCPRKNEKLCSECAQEGHIFRK